MTRELYYIGAPDGLAAVYVKDAIKGGKIPAPPDMQKLAGAGADLQSAPLNYGSVIRYLYLYKFNSYQSFLPCVITGRTVKVIFGIGN